MALPNTGYLLLGADGGASGRSINSEFGLGNDMATYLGVYYGKSGVLYRFPVAGNSLDMQAFYGVNKITSGSANFGSSQSWVVPVYNSLNISVTGAPGGNGGSYGVNACNSGLNYDANGGNAGNATNFGGYLQANGGAGGGAGDGGGSNGNSSNANFNNPLQGGNGPTSGSTIYITVGTGGNGGSGATNYPFLVYGCFAYGNAAAGNANGNGSASASWS